MRVCLGWRSRAGRARDVACVDFFFALSPGPIVEPSSDWEALTKETYEKLENATDRWNVVFHDNTPHFAVLNELAAWAKTEIKGNKARASTHATTERRALAERPFRFGHVNVEKETELAANLEVRGFSRVMGRRAERRLLQVDYVPLLVTLVDGQVHDFYSYLTDLDQLKAWLQGMLWFLPPALCPTCPHTRTGGYVISSPFAGGEAADEDFSQEELEAMEKV